MASLSSSTLPAPKSNRGFSLVELMVGLAVGLLVILIITQAIAMFETQKRTTTSGSDAQQSGLLGLFSIEQDIRAAGAGFNSANIFQCINQYSSVKMDAASAPVVNTALTLIPVLIQDGGAAPGNNSDSIVVRTGSNIAGSVRTRLREETPSSTPPFNLVVERIYDFVPNDLIVVVANDNSSCVLMKVTSVTAGTRTLGVASGTGYPEYNPAAPPSVTPPWPTTFPENSWVYRVGNTAAVGGGGISSRTYRQGTNLRLEVVDSSVNPPVATFLADGIVNIQAQYGLSAAAITRDVTSWQEPTGAFDAATLSGTGGLLNRQRIKAIRIAIIARSGNRERDLVTTQCAAIDANRPDCACQGATTNFGPCAWRDIGGTLAPAVDLRGAVGDTEWQHYRYKVFQTTIPIRNTTWAY